MFTKCIGDPQVKLLVVIDKYDCPVHPSSRTYSPDFLSHGPSRYCPIANSEFTLLCEFQSYSILMPFSDRFQSGSAPSPMIVCFGKTCMQMRFSLVRLVHFPLNPMRYSSETLSNQHSSRSHGRHGPCETYRGSRSN